MRRKRAKTDHAAIKYVQAKGGYECYFDGCCEPRNPGGNMGYGALIMRGGVKVWEHSGMIASAPTNSNNVAEYMAFAAILDWFIEQGLTGEAIVIKGDSNLVIQQCFGTWRIHGIDTKDKPKGAYADLAAAARDKVRRFKNLRGTWISRNDNGAADDLSKSHLRAAGVEFRIQPE